MSESGAREKEEDELRSLDNDVYALEQMMLRGHVFLCERGTEGMPEMFPSAEAEHWSRIVLGSLAARRTLIRQRLEDLRRSRPLPSSPRNQQPDEMLDLSAARD